MRDGRFSPNVTVVSQDDADAERHFVEMRFASLDQTWGNLKRTKQKKFYGEGSEQLSSVFPREGLSVMRQESLDVY